MTRARFRFQVAIVVALIVLVSWPQWRPIRATSIWYARGPLTAAQQTEVRAVSGDRNDRPQVGYGSLAARDTGVTTLRESNARVPNRSAPSYAASPSEMAAIGARVNGIVGRARTSLNVPVPYAR